MKQYDDYKDSGLPWLGRVPAHWEVKKVKYVAEIVNGATPETGTEAFWDGDIVWLTPTDLGKLDSAYASDSKRRLTEAGFRSCGTSLVPSGAVILTTRAPIGNVCITQVEACTNQGCKALMPLTGDNKYLYYQLVAYRPFLEMLGSGSTFMELSTDKLKSFALPVPSLPEQHAIAAYLDRKTGRLDQLLQQKEALRRRLQQQRQALINEAVTRGLDPDAPRRASGVAWLGDVPAHWEVKKLKYTASLKSGDTITAETIELTGEYPVYGGNGLRGYTDSYTHEGNFALIGRQGALCGNINYASGKFFASEHALVAAPLVELETVWLGELLRTMNLGQYSQASAQPGISADRILNLLIPVPPLSEQRAIVAHIEAKTSKITAALEALRKQLKALAAYRQALVAEVVTGKVDVRGEQPLQQPQSLNAPSLHKENQVEDAQLTASGQLGLF